MEERDQEIGLVGGSLADDASSAPVTVTRIAHGHLNDSTVAWEIDHTYDVVTGVEDAGRKKLTLRTEKGDFDFTVNKDNHVKWSDEDPFDVKVEE